LYSHIEKQVCEKYLKRVQFTPPPLELRPNTYFNREEGIKPDEQNLSPTQIRHERNLV